MNKYVLFVFGGILFFHISSYAQTVSAYFDYAPFYSKDIGSYVETYISFDGKSLRYVINSDSVLEASVQVTMLFKNANEIIEFRKYNVISPPVIEPNKGFPDFIDLQRISIPEGIYNFELFVRDNNGSDSIKEFKTNQLIAVDMPENDLALSGIEFVDRYELSDNSNIYIKDSMECIPYVSDNFGKDVNYLRFYAELYNAAKGIGPFENFTFEFHIEETNTGKPIKEFSSFIAQHAIYKNVIFKEINIKKLPSGNYYLVVEVHDNQNNLILTSKKFFKRTSFNQSIQQVDFKRIVIANTFVSNYTKPDTLLQYIRALRPICDLNEKFFIDSTLTVSNLKLMQQFFYNFWKVRNEKNPELDWNEYLTNLKTVEQRFKNSDKNGYETDRGKVFLQFGPPNSINEENSGTATFPHEIWDYYKIADQTNIQFIFYNKSDLANDFELLHSNMKGFNVKADSEK